MNPNLNREVANMMSSIHEIPLDDDDIDLILVGLSWLAKSPLCGAEADELMERLKESREILN